MPASPTRAQLSGARDEFLLAATVQNLKTLALRLLGPPHPAGRSRGTCGAVQCLTAMQTIAQSAWQRILWGMISRQTDRLPRCKRDKMKPRWRTGPQLMLQRETFFEEGHTVVRTQRTAEGKRAFEQITPVMADPAPSAGFCFASSRLPRLNLELAARFLDFGCLLLCQRHVVGGQLKQCRSGIDLLSLSCEFQACLSFNSILFRR